MCIKEGNNKQIKEGEGGGREGGGRGEGGGREGGGREGGGRGSRGFPRGPHETFKNSFCFLPSSRRFLFFRFSAYRYPSFHCIVWTQISERLGRSITLSVKTVNVV